MEGRFSRGVDAVGGAGDGARWVPGGPDACIILLYPRLSTWARIHVRPAASRIQPGETSTLDLVVPTGVRCVVEWPPIPQDDYLLHYVWRDASGAIAIDDFGTSGHRASPSRLDRTIPPGRYTITGENANRPAVPRSPSTYTPQNHRAS